MKDNDDPEETVINPVRPGMPAGTPVAPATPAAPAASPIDLPPTTFSQRVQCLTEKMTQDASNGTVMATDTSQLCVYIEDERTGSSFEVQELLCAFIERLFDLAKADNAVLISAACQTMNAVLQHHTTVPLLVLRCLQTTEQHTLHSESVRRTFRDQGTLAPIHAALHTHAASTDVQRWGCAAVCQLSSNNDANCDVFRQLGTLPLIDAALHTHAASTVVQEWGCAAVCKLAHNRANRDVFRELGTLPLIHAALHTHAASTVVQGWGCIAVGNLAHNYVNRDVFRELGTLPLIHAALHTHVASTDVQVQACYAVCHLSYKNDANCNVFRDLGTCALVDAAIRTYTMSEDVQLGACRAVYRLAHNDACCAAFVGLGTLELMHEVMRISDASGLRYFARLVAKQLTP